MDNINDIEKQIAQNANNQTFEYKEAYWDSALATLQAAEKAKRRKGLFWIFFGALLLGGTTAFILANSLNKNETAYYTPRQSTYSNNLAENNISTPNNYGKEINVNESGNTTKSTNNYKPQNNTNNNLNNSITNTNTNTVKSTPNNSENANREINATQSNPISKKEVSFTPVTPVKTNTNYTAPNNTSLTPTSNDLNTQKLIVFNSTELDSNASTDSLAQYYGEKEELKIISYEENNRKLSFVINLGAIASKNFTENHINFDAPYLGGELYYQISNKLNASIGGGWYTRSKIGYLTNYSTTQYGFGKSETTTTVSFDKIYFVEIPLKINYALTKNHLVGAGATYSLILGGENRVFSSQTESGAYGTLSTQSEQEQSIPGFEGAYTKNSKAIFLSYEYRYKRLGAEVRYHYGLNDITNDNIFKKTQVDRNSRFLITLKYLLFK